MNLNSQNLPDYLRKIEPNLGFKIDKIISAVEFDQYSNNNFLFKVECETDSGTKKLFLKQALPFNKRSQKRGEPLAIDPKRMFGEVKIIRLLANLWGESFVPHIYYFDEKNMIMVMSDVSEGGKLLIEEFNQNRVHPELGSLFGTLFGKLHSKTYQIKEIYAGSTDWYKRMIWFLEDHIGDGIKKFVAEKLVAEFFQKSERAPHSVIWNDPVYRNIFVKKDLVSVVDFDHTINFDPAVDNGMFLAHWVWMMLKGNKKLTQDCQKFIKDYIQSYKMEMPKSDEILQRSLCWMGIYLVSRTDGTSGSYFKDNPIWEAKIRQTGIDLFNGKDFKELTGV